MQTEGLESEEEEEQDSMTVEPSIAPTSTRKSTSDKSTSDFRTEGQMLATEVEAELGSKNEESQLLGDEEDLRDSIEVHEPMHHEQMLNARSSARSAPQRQSIATSGRSSGLRDQQPRAPSLQPVLNLGMGQSPPRLNRIAFSPLPSRILANNPKQGLRRDRDQLVEQETKQKEDMGNDDDSNADFDHDGYAESESDDEMVADGMDTARVDDDIIMSGARTMGDDTMMKSMDMTIVSPGSLYSRLDMQSSFMQATPAATMAKGKQIIEKQPTTRSVVQSGEAEVANQSASHVQWSSPLVIPSEKHTPNAQAQPTRSSSISRQRSIESSPSKRSSLRTSATRSPAQQLPTPDSDEVDKENKAVPAEARDEDDEEEVGLPSAPASRLSRSQSAESLHSSGQPNAGAEVEEIEIYEDETASAGPSPSKPSSVKLISVSEDEDEGYQAPETAQADNNIRLEDDQADLLEDKQLVKNVDVQNNALLEDSSEITMKDTRSLPVNFVAEAEETMDLWQQAGEYSMDSSDVSRVSNKSTFPSSRPGRKWQRPRIQPVKVLPTENQLKSKAAMRETSNPVRPPISGRPATQNITFSNDEIARMFENASRLNHAQAQVEQEEESSEEDISNQNLSSALRHKISDMMDDVDFSLAANKQAPRASIETPTRSHDQGVKISVSLAPHLSALPLTRQPHSPRRSSPLRHRADDDDSGDSRVDQASLLSDVRQIQGEARDVQRTFSARPRRPQQSLLKLTQERRARATIVSPVDRSFFDSTIIGSSAVGSSALDTTEESIDENSSFSVQEQSKPTIFSSARSLLPAFGDESSTAYRSANVFQAKPQVHRLLTTFRLLPSNHPWTDNHFQSLLSLFRHWQKHEHMYASSNPANAGILTARWTKYVDMEIVNWGYDLTLNGSLVMIAALFSRLLELENESHYQQVYGETMRKGVVADKTSKQGPINDWHIVLRLSTVILGDVIRKDEARGIVIDRTPALKWRFKGQLFWRRGWFAGIL